MGYERVRGLEVLAVSVHRLVAGSVWCLRGTCAPRTLQRPTSSLRYGSLTYSSGAWSKVLDPRFVILGALLSSAGALGYARQTLLGAVAPNRVTWLLWTIAPLIACAAELTDGVGLPALLAF